MDKLPRWADVVLVPLICLIIAFAFYNHCTIFHNPRTLYSSQLPHRHRWQTMWYQLPWILVCILAFQARNSIFSLVFYSILSFFILFQTKFQSFKAYTDVIDRDNEIKRIKSEVEVSAKEMENMVSNVTHDLKSVSL